MNGTTAVPKYVLSDIKGRNITLVLDMGVVAFATWGQGFGIKFKKNSK
jgi:hypothetical protein